MKINVIIRTRRQALGLTQEQLAEKLGVSGPAVTKWERAIHYPDITLLPALARTLGVDLNTLLSFQEDLSETEIGLFLNQVCETGRTEGTGAAFALAREKLWEFPNSDLLAYSLAGMLEGLLTLSAEEEVEMQSWKEEVEKLYERSLLSTDGRVREYACYTLASRCVGRGELERAQTLLDQLSDIHMEKRTLTAALRRKEGRTAEAWKLMEQELFQQAHRTQSTLMQMVLWALEDGETSYVHLLADRAEQAGAVMELADYAVLSAPLQAALADQDGPLALSLLERMLHSLEIPWDLSKVPLYRHLSTREAAAESQSGLISAILEEIQRDPSCAFLLETPGYEDLLRRYQA